MDHAGGTDRRALADVLERVSDAFVALDREWRYTYVNPQAAALFGRTPEQLVGKHIWSEFPEGIGQPFHLAYERAMAEQKAVFFEDYYAPWDRWFENRVYPSPEGVSIFFHEITDRKRVERAEHEATERLRQVVANAHEGIAVFDRELRYVLVNPELERVTELAAAALIGRTPAEVMPAPLAADVMARARRALAGELVETPERPLTRPGSGTTIWLATLLSPLRDATGRIVGVLALLRDVTDRAHAEASLRMGEERLRLALAAADAGVWDWDLGTGVIVWSPEHERLWGMAPGTFAGTYEEFIAPIHPEDREDVERGLRNALASRSGYRAELRVRLADGAERWIAGSGHALYAEDGTATRMLGTVIDVAAPRARRTARRLVRQRGDPSVRDRAAGRGAGVRPRLLIADDHDIVRQGLRRVLDAHGEWDVVAEAADGRAAVELARRHRPDVAVLDYSMPALNGLEATRQILTDLPRAEVLVLTMHDSELLVREVLAAGAKGYILKTDAGRLLIQAVETLLRHKPFFTPTVSEMLLGEYLRPGAERRTEVALGALTAREREVVQMIAEGRSTKEIADTLGLSVKTAETHRANVMRKLRLGSVAELVRWAIRNKVIEP